MQLIIPIMFLFCMVNRLYLLGIKHSGDDLRIAGRHNNLTRKRKAKTFKSMCGVLVKFESCAIYCRIVNLNAGVLPLVVDQRGFSDLEI